MTQDSLRRRTEVARGGIERRAFGNRGGVELRNENDGMITIGGYACVFDRLYTAGSYQETVASAAFNRTRSEAPDTILNVDHGESLSALPLARTRSAKAGPGSLELSVDGHGLRFSASLDAEDPMCSKWRGRSTTRR